MSSINEQRGAIARMREEFAAAQSRREVLRSAAVPAVAALPEDVNHSHATVETELPEAAALRDRPDTP